jgi:hypothetical protein
MSEALPRPTLGTRFKSAGDHIAAFYQGLSNLLKTIFWILVFATLLAVVLLVGFGFIRVDNVLIDMSSGSIKVGMKDPSAPPGPAVASAESPRTEPARTDPPPTTVKAQPPLPVVVGPAPVPVVETEYNVVLVFDRASVPEEGKPLFTQARACAMDFVSSLDSRHAFSLLAPNAGNMAWPACDLNLATDRAVARQKIEYLWTAGRRATCDAVAKALDHLQAPAATRPGVVLVVTPAGIDESQLPPGELLVKLKPDSHKRSVKLHAIVYGPAGMNVDEDEVARTLRQAAQTTGGTFQAAGPDDLAAAFQKVGKTGLAGR